MKQPLVTISFIHYSELHGFSTLRHLEPFLQSLLAQTYHNVEIYCVDNASTDLRYLDVLKKYPHIKLIQNPVNTGTCAHNLVYKKAKGKYLWCTTLDTRYTPEFLEDLVDAAESLPKGGSFGGTLLQWNATSQQLTSQIDTQGIRALRNHQFVELEGGNLWTETMNTIKPVFGISGATVLYRMDALQDIAYHDKTFIDEMFFMYKEDIDVAYRLLWAGYTNYCVEHAIGYHVRTVKEEHKSPIQTLTTLHNRRNKSQMNAALSLRNHLYLLQKNFSNMLPRRIIVMTYISTILRLLFVFLVERRILSGWKEFQSNRNTLRITPKLQDPKYIGTFFS